MSLITDTLKKMRKDDNNSSVKKDDEVLAPPALRNAIVNTKKYKEFVKSAELRDINGNKAPLKGFVLVSILLLAVIGITTALFLRKDDNSMVQKAGIEQSVASNTQAQKSQAQSTQSLGRPYGSTAENTSNNTNINQADNTENNHITASAMPPKSDNTANMQTAQEQNISNSGSAALQQKDASIINNNNQTSALAKNNASDNKAEKVKSKNTEKYPANVIAPNQLFFVPQVQNNTTEAGSNTEPITENIPANNSADKNVSSSANTDNSVTVNNNGVSNSNISENPLPQKESVTAATSAETPDIKKEQNIIPETSKAEITKTETSNTVKSAANSIEDSKDTSISSINEVKTMKTTEKPGTVTASTVSLYNQYISTGNKAKNEGAYDRAIEYYVNALALNKTDELSANIALMYIKLKNPNMAFQVSVTNGIKNTKLLSQLAIIMIQQKYFLEANKLIQYANTFDRSADILLATGYLNQAQNKISDAIKYYEEAMAVDVSNVNAAYYAGMCYELQGMNDNAKKMYEKVIANPSADSKLKASAKQKLSAL